MEEEFAMHEDMMVTESLHIARLTRLESSSPKNILATPPPPPPPLVGHID